MAERQEMDESLVQDGVWCFCCWAILMILHLSSVNSLTCLPWIPVSA